jgi:hypothetical protein
MKKKNKSCEKRIKKKEEDEKNSSEDESYRTLLNSAVCF